jgi:hypothetical protein
MSLLTSFAPRLHEGRLHLGSGLAVTFQRTLRVPDDGRKYPLPPGLGCFPIRRVDDYADRVPERWRAHGGVFIPMYQREALWLSFAAERPHALKVGVGKVCALTGRRWSETLQARPQDYVVVPQQPWLDGIVTAHGVIRQFVAMPLGMGYTVEGQVTGEEVCGGIQLKAFRAKPGRIPEPSRASFTYASMAPCAAAAPARTRASGSLGLAAGGSIEQKVYPDPYGSDVWDETGALRCFVHIVNSELYREITGEAPPPSPVTARAYARRGLPWFALYDERAPSLSAQHTLSELASVKELDEQRSSLPLQDDDPVNAGPVKKLWRKLTAGGVRDGEW